MKSLKHIAFCLALAVFSICSLHGQTTEEIATKFLDFSLESDTLNIKAQLFVPENYDAEFQYPLVVRLHGAGLVGNDNHNHIRTGSVAKWGKNDFQSEHPCFIFCPQAPSGNITWFTSNSVQSIDVLLDSMINFYSIDTSRIYITGNSMGGIGTWKYITADPDRYAAAIPECGGLASSVSYNAPLIEGIRLMPIWHFHGGSDNVVPTVLSRTIVNNYLELHQGTLFTHDYGRLEFNLTDEEIEACINEHQDLLYTEVREIGHNIWSFVNNTPLSMEWLFKQRKRSPHNMTVEKTEGKIEVSGNKEFSFTTSEHVDSVAIWYGQLNSPNMEFIQGFKDVAGSFTFNSDNHDDYPFSVLKFLAFDEEGYVIGKDYTSVFNINNSSNGSPSIEILNDLALFTEDITLSKYKMKIRTGDPESASLQITYSVSIDGGQSYVDIINEETSTEEFEKEIILSEIDSSDHVILRVSVSDGEYTATDQTLVFKNLKGKTVPVLPQMTNNFRIYPNPTSKVVFLDFEAYRSGKVQVDLLSLNGRLIYRHEEEVGAGKVELDLPDLELDAGSYILLLNMMGTNQMSRTIVIH